MNDMTTLDELRNKPRDQRTAIEQCIIDSADLEDMRDGNYSQQEVALLHLQHLISKKLEGISAYDIANAAVDELFTAGDGTIAHRIELKSFDEKGHGGWAKIPARNIILKHIRAALRYYKDRTALNGGIDDRGDAAGKHRLKRTTITPGEPDVFIARCDYQSENENEFTVTGKVTCPKCKN